MFSIVQLSHDLLTDRMLIGVQGPSPTDFISINCALPAGPGGSVRDLRTEAMAEAARLLSGAAQVLRDGQQDGLVPSERPAPPWARFVCECCGVVAPVAGVSPPDPSPASED